MKINTELAKQLIFATKLNNGGEIFSVKFLKKDGTLREMVARLGVTKHLTGQGAKYNASDYGLITVFDMQKKEYRNININTIKSVKINKKEYTIGE